MNQDESYKVVRKAGCQLIYNPAIVAEPDATWLASGELQKSATSERIGQGGRGQAWFVELNGTSSGSVSAVLRHYQRGGLLARFNRQTYLGLGAQNSRAFREWRLLDWMYKQGLPVPRPVAASICRWPFRFSPLYRAHILVERIDDVETLDQVLARQSLPLDSWSRMGASIARLHQVGIFHADLNANNILLGGGERVYLIDFDKGELRPNSPQDAEWKLDNLQRLYRSLLKQQGLSTQYHFEDMDWQVFLAAYRGE